MSGSTAQVPAAAFSVYLLQGCALISSRSAADGVIKLWDIGQRTAVYSNSSTAEVWGFDWQPVGANGYGPGKQFAIAGDDKAVTLYRAAGSA